MTETLTYQPDSTSHLTYIHSLKDFKYRIDIEDALALNEYETLKRIVRGEWSRDMLSLCKDSIKNALYDVRCDVTRGLCTPDNVEYHVSIATYNGLDVDGVINGTRPRAEPLPPPLGCA